MKNKHITLAYLVNVDIDEVVERHIKHVCYQTEVDYTTVTCTGESNPKFITVKAYPKPSVAIIKQKYRFLLHIIITRCMNSENNKCTLNSDFFTHHIFHDQFTPMIYNLCQMGIISSGTYSAGSYNIVTHQCEKRKESTPYYLMDWDIDYMKSTNANFIKWSKILTAHNKVNEKKYKMCAFTDNYNKSLKEVRLVDRDGALLYLKNIKKDTHEYYYNLRFIDNFDQVNKGIYSIDDQGRIYHILTSLPKMLRPYYNIKYEFDIANSHPVLFNDIIIQYYNINKGVLHIINNIINTNKHHYDSEFLRNELKNNNIEEPIFGDVLEYMVKTQQGKFYDDFCEIFHDKDRSEVKTKLFQHVFYSHLQDNKRYSTQYLRAFKEKYPHVWKVIYAAKINTNDKLPHKMMAIESSLFRPILQECWKNGWKAVNIHDALVVLDCPENDGVTANDVKDVIERHYHKFGLYPTIKAEIEEDAS